MYYHPQSSYLSEYYFEELFEFATVKIKMKILEIENQMCAEATLLSALNFAILVSVAGTSAVLTVKPPRLRDFCFELNEG